MGDRERSPHRVQWGDREFVLRQITTVGYARVDEVMQKASEDLRSDKEVVLQALRYGTGHALQYASDALKADEEVVQRTTGKDVKAFQYASEALKGDRDVVLTAVSEAGMALQYASEELKTDPVFVLEAVSQSPRAFLHVAEHLRAHREIAVQAVRSSCGVEAAKILKAASADLRADRELVLEAVTRCGTALEHASSDLKRDREIVCKAIEQSVYAFRFVDDSLKADPEVALKAVGPSQNHGALREASARLQQDPAFIVQAMQLKRGIAVGSFLFYEVPKEMKGNLQVVRAAVSLYTESLRYAANGVGAELARDASFRQEYLKNHCVFIIHSMSGSSCADVYPKDENYWLSDMKRRALRSLNFEKHEDPDFVKKAALFTLAGLEVTYSTMHDWVCGEVVELQLVIRSS